MPIAAIDIATLSNITVPKAESCSHDITQVSGSDPDDIWYCKAALNAKRAHYEVLGQEFYRLLIPRHPEVRLARDVTSDQYFVLSKKVNDFHPIPIDKQIRLNSGIYTGLGQILVTSVFLHEIDLNTGNLGINDHNEIIKIDGDWIFASFIMPELFHDKATTITAELLQRLPYLSNYDVHNWLDLIQKDQANASSKLFSEELITAPHFRLEVNTAILKIILLPNNYIQHFIALYLPEDTEMLTDYLIHRKSQLQESAAQNTSFVEFLLTEEANRIGRSFLQHIKDFQSSDTQSPMQSLDDVDFDSNYLDCLISLQSCSCSSPKTVATHELGMFKSNTLKPLGSGMRLNRTMSDLTSFSL